jgi:hypothetical protein
MRMAAGLAVLMAAAAPASADRVVGEWCEADGERLVIDGDVVGFNEHTVCEWSENRPEGGAFDVMVSCANIHADGQGGWVRMDERAVRLQADRDGPDEITVTVEDGQPVRFARCDG